MKRWIDRDGMLPDAIVCDHDLEDRMTLERHLGLSTIAAKKDVSTGIEAVQRRLQKDKIGQPALRICQNSVIKRDPELVSIKKPTCLEEEVSTYVWDMRPQPGGGNTREAPVKQDDHACDALRYAVAYLDLQQKFRYRSFTP
jgi:phage terminase large subunit